MGPPLAHFDTDMVLSGPLRHPRQLLGQQRYGDHASIHDDETATALGFARGAIEGPTHFSQFIPLFATLWDIEWFEAGCISAHYESVCYEGEAVTAAVTFKGESPRRARMSMQKDDGSRVLSGTASIGSEHGETELEARLSHVNPGQQPRILDRLAVGQKTAPETIIMQRYERMGDLYPFSLEEKLQVITEPHPWYTEDGGHLSPWGKAIIPLEMLSVLTQYTSADVFPVRQPSVGLFIDQEIRMIGGPLFVGQEYVLDREVVALGESRRTESYWVVTTVHDADRQDVVLRTLLHMGILKESYNDGRARQGDTGRAASS